ncbi:MAG: ABC transporter substrate-binding protein [Desulfobacter sp.]|nr:MAG: ABC transporter substrate-binding protein [Desulfobacter sp.]
MEKMVPGTPLQQKSTPPTWLIEGPFSDLTFTSAGAEADPGTETVTQNSEHSPFIKQAQAFGLFKKMLYFHPDAGGNYELMSAMGNELPLGLILSARHHNNWPDTEANKNFVATFKKRTGRFPTYAAEGAYAGIYAIAAAVEKVGNPDDTEALVKALEGLKIKLPEDPEGFTSYIYPATHQMVQAQAIGTTIENKDFPPATRMLGNWKIYKAEDLIPPAEYIDMKRK